VIHLVKEHPFWCLVLFFEHVFVKSQPNRKRIAPVVFEHKTIVKQAPFVGAGAIAVVDLVVFLERFARVVNDGEVGVVGVAGLVEPGEILFIFLLDRTCIFSQI